VNTCANCRHWRPHAGTPTNRVCGLIRQQRRQRSPAHHPRPRAAEACRPPMVLATPSGFGCSLYEDQSPEPNR